MSSEKFCLKWNDFESNISLSFREIRNDNDFFDVTLACDDDQIQAHKLILSACSPFFKTVLRKNPHQHPLLYLRGIKFRDIESILEFMYHGEVNVAQEDLNSFLSISEELQVKGLTQGRDGKSEPVKSRPPQPPPPPRPSQSHKRQKFLPEKPELQREEEDDEIEEVTPIKTEPTPSQEVSQLEDNLVSYEENYEEYGQYEEANYSVDAAHGNKERYAQLQEFIKQNSGPGNSCLICGKNCSKLHAVQYHIESAHGKHFNVTYECELCNKIVDTKNAYITHKSRNHKKAVSNIYNPYISMS